MRRFLCLLMPVLFAGCGQSPSNWPVSFDLVAGLAVADSWSETRVIDLGTHRSRRHLVSGWSENQWDRHRSRGFITSQAPAATLEFEIIEPRPMVLRFFAGPVDEEAPSPTAIEVSVNGSQVGDLSLQGRPRRIRVAVPEGLLQRGANRLVLRSPDRTGAPDLPVRWYEIELQFQDQVEATLPMVTGQDDALLIPYGTRLEYTLKLPSPAMLTVDRLQWMGQAGGSLSLWLQEDGAEATRLELPAGLTEGIELPLPAGGSRIVRLTLAAEHPHATVSQRAGAVLTGAAVRAPMEPSTAHSAESPILDRVTPARAEMPNVILYVVDTLRADHLGVYGYDKPVSPALDAFAAQATVFDNAVAQSSWTRASMASIFTGLWPLKHAANGRKDVLDPAATTLAEVLAEAGYVTAAKVRNWNVFPIFGFRQGFDDYHRVRDGKADRVHALVENWLSDRPRDRPFFLWVHTVDPHEPYRPPAETRREFLGEDQAHFDLDKHPGFKLTREMSEEEKREVVSYLLSLYDAEIAFNDRAFGELVALLEEAGLLDSTVVIFVSDHGEEFLDHGTWGHGRNLYAENLNVPLVVRFPDLGHGLRVEEVVQQIDLMPTLLDYIGLPVPDGVEGRSLLPLLTADSGDERTPRPAFSYLHLDGAVYRSLVDGDWKLVQRLTDEGGVSQSGLFHRRTDPGERRNQIDDLPIRGRYMELILEAKVAEGGLLATEEAVLDEETERALKALGYLQ